MKEILLIIYLYTQNRDNFSFRYQCIFETWYLAAEMQMFLVSPLIIYPLWRWRRAGLVWTIIILATFTGLNVGVHIAWNLPPTIICHRWKLSNHDVFFLNVVFKIKKFNYIFFLFRSMISNLFDYVYHYYAQSYFRISPYLLGILLGYAIDQNIKTPKQKPSSHTNYFMNKVGV